MHLRPRHASPTAPAVLTWDAALGPSVLLVAAIVALSVPPADLTLHTVHAPHSSLPASSQQDEGDWSGGRQDP
jgi:hypothetical protein